MLLGPAGINVLLASLHRLPVDRHHVLGHDGLFFLADRSPGRLHDAGVDHLPTTRHMAVDQPLPIERVKNALAGTSLDQPSRS